MSELSGINCRIETSSLEVLPQNAAANYLDPIGRSLLLAIHARQSDFDLYSSLRVSLIRVTRRWQKLHHLVDSFPFVLLSGLIPHSDRSGDEHV